MKNGDDVSKALRKGSTFKRETYFHATISRLKL